MISIACLSHDEKNTKKMRFKQLQNSRKSSRKKKNFKKMGKSERRGKRDSERASALNSNAMKYQQKHKTAHPLRKQNNGNQWDFLTFSISSFSNLHARFVRRKMHSVCILLQYIFALYTQFICICKESNRQRRSFVAMVNYFVRASMLA